MDPQQTYIDMLAAMQANDHETARELALALKEWLARGGFRPHQVTTETMDASIATALRQATRLVENNTGDPFSLICTYCDAGMEIATEQEAIAQGWTGIEHAPDLPNANYLGICPDCKRETD